MLGKKSLEQLRTWIELDRGALRKNARIFRQVVGSESKLWAVVKSNAYGHGLFSFSRLVEPYVHGFCVDSLIEGVKLRAKPPVGAGIRKHILVLGPTLPRLFGEARKRNVTLSVSNFENLAALLRLKRPPRFHLKFDTGMHRQGFYPEDAARVAGMVARHPAARRALSGVFTHFAGANDFRHRAFTERQFSKFQNVLREFERAGFRNLTAHSAATGGTLLNSRYHLDAVRVGAGLYGFWPSRDLEKRFKKSIPIRPVLSWRTVVTEVKKLKKGDSVGYDLTERVRRRGAMAILPVGYWHGLPRALSSRGVVLLRGRRAKILGRVSMDLTAIDARGAACRVGDVVTLIGKNGRENIKASDLAALSGTSTHEFITRLNPLMEKIAL